MTYTIPKKIMGFFFALCMVASNFTMPIHAEETKNYNDFGNVEIQDSNGNNITGDTEAKTSDEFTMTIHDVQFNDDDIKITLPSELLTISQEADIDDPDIDITTDRHEITIMKPEEEESETTDGSDTDPHNSTPSKDDSVQSEPLDEEEYTEDNGSSGGTANGEVYEQKLIRKHNEEDVSDKTYTVTVPFYVTADTTLNLNDSDNNQIHFTYKEEKTDIKGQIKWENDAKKDRPNEVKVSLMNGDEKVKSVEAKKSNDWKYSFIEPKYDADINKINYTVEVPDEVKGYTTDIDAATNEITLTKKDTEEKTEKDSNTESKTEEDKSTNENKKSSDSSKDKDIIVNPDYTITTSASEGGTIDPSTTISKKDGTKDIHYWENDGYEVKNVKVNGEEVDDKDGTYTFTYDDVKNGKKDDTKIEVTFEKKKATYTISTNVSPEEGGQISPSVKVDEGKDATISYKPNDGYQVDTVKVNGKEIQDKSGSYTFEKVQSDQSIEVAFKPKSTKSFKITTKAGPHGRIDQSVNVNQGGSAAIRYQADPGYEIDTVKVDGVVQHYTCGIYTFYDVAEDHTIEVTFKKAPEDTKTVQLVKDSTTLASVYKNGQIYSTVNWSIKLNDDGSKNPDETQVGFIFGFENGGSQVTLDPTSTSWLSNYETYSAYGYTIILGVVDVKDFSKFNDGILNGSGTLRFNAKSSSYAYEVQPEVLTFVPETSDIYDDVLSNVVTVPASSKVITTTTVTGTKTWDDNNNSAKKRPDAIVIYLYYGKNKDDRIARVITGTGNTWKYTFTGLPKYDSNGKEIQYSIREQALNYYDGTVRGYNLTNKYNGNPRKGTVRVNTGQETNSGLYIGLLCAAAAVIIVVVVMKKKNSNQS